MGLDRYGLYFRGYNGDGLKADGAQMVGWLKAKKPAEVQSVSENKCGWRVNST